MMNKKGLKYIETFLQLKSNISGVETKHIRANFELFKYSLSICAHNVINNKFQDIYLTLGITVNHNALLSFSHK